MKQYLSILIGLISLMPLSVLAQEFNMNWDKKPRVDLILHKELDSSYIYEVRYDIYRHEVMQAGLKVKENQTAVIHVCKNHTLDLRVDFRYAAIEVPSSSTLIISGDENSFIYVKGGNAQVGGQGEWGTNAYVTMIWKKKCWAGGGAKGGHGGFGGGAGIGGSGGEGGNAGEGTPNVETVSFATIPGLDGQAGSPGTGGTSMGRVFISGDVKVRAERGRIGEDFRREPGAGDPDRSDYWVPFSYHRMNGGGGGGGGNGGNGGTCTYDIGGGAPGGGGGGGGGSGALDEYGGKDIRGIGSCGQGGRGGYQNDMDHQAAHGMMLQQVPLAHSPHLYSGKGGMAGTVGDRGANGTLFLQSTSNIADSITSATCQSWATIDPIAYPLDLYVIYDNIEPCTGGPADYKFYYGMVAPQKIAVPQHALDPTNYRFGGYFLTHEEMIYNQNGTLTEEGKRILYRYSDVKLTARWLGPSSIHLLLKYEKPQNDSKNTSWIKTTIDSFYKLNVKEIRQIPINAGNYLPKEGYHAIEPSFLFFNLGPEMAFIDSFTYILNRHQLEWVIPTSKGGIYQHVYMRDSLGNKVTTWKQTMPYGVHVTEPTLYFDTKDDSLSTKVAGWTNMPRIMPDANVNNITLRLDSVVCDVYTNQSDSGQVAVRNKRGEVVTTCSYGEELTIQLTPNEGCYAARPIVSMFQYGLVGDTLPLTKNGENTYTFRCTSPVLIKPIFQPNKHSVSVRYVGQLPAGAQARTFAVSKGHPQAQDAQGLTYPYKEVISFTGWVDKDTMDNWLLTPVVRTLPKGDTVPLQVGLSEDFEDRDGKKMWFVCYFFEAPDSNVEIEQTIDYLPRTACKIFNQLPNVSIDTVFINFNAVTLPKDSIIKVRSMDVITIQVNHNDTTAMQAGYWDDQSQYQSLQKYVEYIELPTGDYTTRFSTLAPAAPMAMGLTKNTPTGFIETVSEMTPTGATKILFQGQLFIIRDGVIYNAQGQVIRFF